MYLKQIEDACLCNRLSFLSLVANLSQLLLSFLLVNNIIAKKSRAGGRSLIFLSVKILKWGALICRTELFLGPRILNNTSGNTVVEKS